MKHNLQQTTFLVARLPASNLESLHNLVTRLPAINPESLHSLVTRLPAILHSLAQLLQFRHHRFPLMMVSSPRTHLKRRN